MVVSIVAEERRGSILGAVDILEKPVAREDLLAALRRSLLPAGQKFSSWTTRRTRGKSCFLI